VGDTARPAAGGDKQSFVLETNDVLVMLTGGGAGYGEPADRPRHLSEHDLDQGLIRPATARRVYRFVRTS
jgi:N-methylhydantoinase B